jgi:hypothetical protein
LVQLSVKECIIPEDTQNYELKKLKCLLNRCEVVYTEVSKSYFKLESFEQDMDRLLASETSITTYGKILDRLIRNLHLNLLNSRIRPDNGNVMHGMSCQVFSSYF